MYSVEKFKWDIFGEILITLQCRKMHEIDYLLNVASNSWHFQWSSFICLRSFRSFAEPNWTWSNSFLWPWLYSIPKTTFLSLFDVQASVLKTQHVPSSSHFPLKYLLHSYRWSCPNKFWLSDVKHFTRWKIVIWYWYPNQNQNLLEHPPCWLIK